MTGWRHKILAWTLMLALAVASGFLAILIFTSLPTVPLNLRYQYSSG